jgi:hypothetical protein
MTQRQLNDSKNMGKYQAIRAISHQFAQCQTAIRWLEWLRRKLSILIFLWSLSGQPQLPKFVRVLLPASTEICPNFAFDFIFPETAKKWSKNSQKIHSATLVPLWDKFCSPSSSQGV